MKLLFIKAPVKTTVNDNFTEFREYVYCLITRRVGFSTQALVVKRYVTPGCDAGSCEIQRR